MFARLAHNRRNLDQSGTLGRAPSALAGDQLKKPVLQRPHDDRLNNSVTTNGIRELIQALLIKCFSGLLCVWKNPLDVDLAELLGFKIRRAQQGAQPST